jgi:hypothetical protein
MYSAERIVIQSDFSFSCSVCTGALLILVHADRRVGRGNVVQCGRPTITHVL